MSLAVGGYVIAALGLVISVALRLIWTRQTERERCIFRVIFPREVSPEQVVALWAGLSGCVGDAFTAEGHATSQGIVHRLIAPGGSADLLANQLRAAIPGTRLLPDDLPLECSWGSELRLTSASAPLRSDEPSATSRAILATLSGTMSSGTIVQWTFTPKRTVPLLVPAHGRRPSFEDRLSVGLTDRLRGRRTVFSSDELHRLTQKAKAPLFRASLRVGVSVADTGRTQVSPVLDALDSTRTSGVHFRKRLLPPSWVARRINSRSIPVLVWPVLVNAAEMTALIAWPLDSPTIPGLTVGGTPQLPPVSALPGRGLILGRADFPGMERSVAIGHVDGLRHLYVPGPTGTGKSTLALNLVLQQMAEGHGVCVFDPKGDLVQDLLERIPPDRENDVIVLDPTDERPIGVNLLDGPPGEDDLTADQVVGVFARRFGSAWGPRTDDIARAAVLTLLGDPESTLADLPMLFTGTAFRRALVGKVTDPSLSQFWESFESWSEPERAHNTAPLLNKARAVLMRRPVRAVVGQPSTISLDAVLNEGRILLVNLNVGLLGENAASLLGGLLFARLWAAVQRRAAIPPEERRPFFCTIDEFQTLVTIPTPLEDVLALARGYRFGLMLLHQNLSQLPLDIRQAALANCRTKIVFASGATDAAVFAKEFAPWVDGPGIVGLGAHEVIIGANVEAAQLPPCTAITAPPPPIVGRGALIRAASRKRFGTDPAEIRARWRKRTNPDPAVTPIGRRRKSP